MTALAQARDEQARLGEFLREHVDWRDSDELVDVPDHGRMMACTAYAGALAGAGDWIIEECLILRDAHTRGKDETMGGVG